jgi:hypothetical protein
VISTLLVEEDVSLSADEVDEVAGPVVGFIPPP